MPRYYFHVRDSSSELACTMREIDNPADVRREAIKLAAAQLFDAEGLLRVPADWRMDVVDEAGDVLIRLLYP